MHYMPIDHNKYLVFMLIFSFIIGYFFSMALLAYSPSHITNNFNKIYMALLMATLMGTYHSGFDVIINPSKKNIAILLYFIIISVILIMYIKQQYGINQEQFLLSMIEHHSAAITMSEKVKPKLTDNRVKNLVDNIITSQSKEINEMKNILSIPKIEIFNNCKSLKFNIINNQNG